MSQSPANDRFSYAPEPSQRGKGLLSGNYQAQAAPYSSPQQSKGLLSGNGQTPSALDSAPQPGKGLLSGTRQPPSAPQYPSQPSKGLLSSGVQSPASPYPSQAGKGLLSSHGLIPSTPQPFAQPQHSQAPAPMQAPSAPSYPSQSWPGQPSGGFQQPSRPNAFKSPSTPYAAPQLRNGPAFAPAQPPSTPNYSSQPNVPPAQRVSHHPGFSAQRTQQQGGMPNYPPQTPPWPGASSAPQSGGTSAGRPAQMTPYSGGQRTPPADGAVSLRQQAQYSASPPQLNNLMPVSQSAQRPRKSKRELLNLVCIVVSLVVVLAGVGTLFALHARGSGSLKTPVPGISSASPPHTSPTSTLNQPVQAGPNWVITITHVDTNVASATLPPAGQTYVEINLTLKNTLNRPQLVSSQLQFALADASGKTYTESLTEGNSRVYQSPDGKLTVGQTLTAKLAYLVPQSTHAFVLTFVYDLLSGNNPSVKWNITV